MKIRLGMLGSIFLLMGISPALGQVLSVDEAVQLGLANNFDLQISQNNEVIAQNLNTAGNAGFLPTLRTTGSLGYSRSNAEQQYFNGESRSTTGAGNTSARASLEFDYTIFDGFSRQAARERLDLEEDRSQQASTSLMHQLAAQIRASYYDLVRMKQQIEVIERSIDLNQALLDLASQKLTLGAATELEVLQATTQLNADSSQLVILQGQLSRAKVTFNRLLGIPPAEPFEVTSEYPETVIPNVQQLIEESKTLHPDLQLLRMDEQITDLQVKELKGDLFPTLSFAADYNYSYSKSDVGFLLSNRSFGPSFTLTATYDLFHGRNIGKDLQNIELLSRNLQLDQRNIEEDLHAQIREAYTDYLSYRDLFLLEERNIETASRNAELAREMYERGVSTDYEVREALLNEVRARDRMIDAEYRMKLAEITLLQLAGRQLW